MITLHNGSVVVSAASAATVEYNVQMYEGIQVFLNYTKGTETNVVFECLVLESGHPVTGSYFNTQTSSATPAKQTWTYSASMDGVFLATVPKCANSARITATFTTPGSAAGNLSIYCVPDDKYL